MHRIQRFITQIKKVQQEKRMQAKRQEVERREVDKELAEFNTKLRKVRDAFTRAGSSIYNEFKLSDRNRDGYIGLDEFMITLQRMNVTINPHDILYIYEFID